MNITNNSLVWYGNFSGSKIILDKDINIATGKKLRFSAKDSPTDNELEIDIGLNTFTESGRGELKLNGTSGEILKVYDVTISGTVVIVEEEEELYTANVLGGVSPNTYLWEIRRFGEQTWITIDDTDNQTSLDWETIEGYGIDPYDPYGGSEIEVKLTVTTSPQIWETTGASDSYIFSTIELAPFGKLAAGRLPTTYALDRNYPNPFNPETTISFQVPKASPVRITVYNIAGQEVATLIDRNMNAGFYSVKWDAKNAASGIYLYTIIAGDFTATRRMIVLK